MTWCGYSSHTERERDELRAEVERLNGFVAEMQPELGKLKTEVERLRRECNVAAERMRTAEYRESLLKDDVRRLEGDVSHYRYRAQNAEVDVERLRAALRQILEDPDALILDSHRDDGWAALVEP